MTTSLLALRFDLQMSDENLPGNVSSSGLDLLGLGQLSNALVGPLTRGIGKALDPILSQWENRAQLKKFDCWDEALKAKGYGAKSVELSIAERTEVRVLAEQIQAQENRESVAFAAIDQAKLIPDTQFTTSFLEPDWVDHFWKLAETISNEELQQFWGAIFARTCAGQTKIGPRTLNFISSLSAEEAKALERAAACYIEIEVDKNYMQYGLLTGFSVVDVKERKEIENINTDLYYAIGDINKVLFGSVGVYVESGWGFNISQIPTGKGISFKLGGEEMLVKSSRNLPIEEGVFSFGTGIQISPMGREIFQFLKPLPNTKYRQLIRDGFALLGLH